MAGPFKQSVQFAMVHWATYFLLEVIIAPIVAIAHSAGHGISSSKVGIHFLSLLVVFPGSILSTYFLVRFRPELEDRLKTRRAIAAGALTALLVWGGLFLFDLGKVNIVGELQPMTGKLYAGILQGLTVVVVGSTLSVALALSLGKRDR